MRIHLFVTVILTICFIEFHASSLQAQTFHTVELSGIQFIPADTDISVGDTVHWVWVSGFHNVESGTIVAGSGVHDSNFRSGNPTSVSGTIFDIVFDEAFLDTHPIPNNAYPYYCVVHANFNMAGIVTVFFPGDIDRDSDVDLTDHLLAAICMSGPGDSTLPDGCSVEQLGRADSDGDDDVDLADWAVLQNNITGL